MAALGMEDHMNAGKVSIVAALGLGLASTSAQGQSTMELQPAWEAVLDGSTAVDLKLDDRELAGGRLFLAFRRLGTAGFTVQRIVAATGELEWDTTFVSDGSIGGEVVADLEVDSFGREAFVISKPDFRITRFSGVDGAAEVFDVLTGTDGERLALTPNGQRLVAAGEEVVATYERASGARLWTAALPAGELLDLAVDGRRVFVVAGTAVVALRLVDGSTAWTVDLQGFEPLTLEKGVGNAPLVVSGSAGSRGLDAETGALLWSADLAGPKTTSLSPDGNVVYRHNGVSFLTGPSLSALELATGLELWSIPVPLVLTVLQADPMVSPDGTRLALPGWKQTFVHDALTGSLVFTVPFSAGPTTSLESVSFGPTGDELLVVGDAPFPTPLVVVSQALPDGAEVWSHFVEGIGSSADTLHTAALSPDGMRWFLGGRGGEALRFELAAFDAGSGALSWSTEDESLAHAERLAASNQAVFAIAGDDLAAYQGSNGAELWLRAGDLPHDLAAAQDGTALYELVEIPNVPGNSDFGVRRLDPSTGAEVWFAVFDGEGSYDAPGAIDLSPDGSTVYVAGRKRFPSMTPVAHVATLALDAASGAVLWESLSPEGAEWNARDVLVAADGARIFVLAGKGPGGLGASRFLAYDAATGAELWKTPVVALSNVDYPSLAAALSADGTRLIGAGFGTFVFGNDLEYRWSARVLDTATGAVVWDRDIHSTYTYPEVIDVLVTSAAPTVVVCGQPTSKLLVGLDLATGDELWHASSWPAFPPGGVHLAEQPATGRFLVAHTRGGITSDFRAAAFDLPSLVSSPAPISLASGGERELRLRAGAVHGGESYWILGSASGSGEGLQLPNGDVLPLVPDAYFALTQRHALALFAGFAGSLSPAGEARAVLAIRSGADSSLAGLRLTHAALVVDPAGAVSLATNAVDVVLQP